MESRIKDTDSIFIEYKDKSEIAKDFEIDPSELKDCHIIIAYLEAESYSGSNVIIYKKDNKYYGVFGGHCSCYGFEGQWEPEELLWEQVEKEYEKILKEIKMKTDFIEGK